eukprot:TRINITY_DN4935_c0_g1_i2.p1 TRINITY_DN4935_c0_g1~~TRINITY_DN4935_c0_g1_i2.p1  ORF type:complete len:337 (-),score=65.03 TRINITY_DN4935_c0_g1_i2:87-1097(-)
MSRSCILLLNAKKKDAKIGDDQKLKSSTIKVTTPEEKKKSLEEKPIVREGITLKKTLSDSRWDLRRKHPITIPGLENASMTGWLRLKNEVKKVWENRYFVIQGNKLFYYKKSKKTLKLKDTVELKNAIVGTLKQKQNSFCLGMESSMIFLKATTKEEMNSWIQALNKVIAEERDSKSLRSSKMKGRQTSLLDTSQSKNTSVTPPAPKSVDRTITRSKSQSGSQRPTSPTKTAVSFQANDSVTTNIITYPKSDEKAKKKRSVESLSGDEFSSSESEEDLSSNHSYSTDTDEEEGFKTFFNRIPLFESSQRSTATLPGPEISKVSVGVVKTPIDKLSN